MRQSGVSASLVEGAKMLIAQAETICDTDPGMCDAAAMVYVGDIYALREAIQAVSASDQDECSYSYSPDIIDYAL